MIRSALGALALLLAAVLVYQPAWHAGYIWDDDLLISNNECVVGPSGLREIWTTKEADICPLTISAFWAEYKAWGASPMPYHLVNIFLHAACAVLLWQVLRTLQIPGAWLGAALWALHPVQVESVAWITETKNTLSGVFFLLTILGFLRWRRAGETSSGSAWLYTLTLIWAALAMAGKSSTVVLPAVLCLLAWWQDKGWRGRDGRVVVPVLLMAVAAGVFSVWSQAAQAAAGFGAPPARSLPQRLAGAGDAVWFYLGKLVWPQPLMTIYPRWEIDAGRWYAFLPLLAVAGLLLVLWRKRRMWTDAPLLGLTYFLVALSPVLGVIEMSFTSHSLVADHFLYLASMAPAALAGAGLARWRPGMVMGGCALLILGWVSWHRTRVYESQETLWADELAKNPLCWTGHEQLGENAMINGRMDEAMARFRRVLEIRPRDANALGNLANGLLQTGRLDEAGARYRQALDLDAHHAFLHTGLGVVLAQTGRVDEAIRQYREASEIDPNYADAHNDLGGAFMQKGQWDDAVAEYRLALKIDPVHGNARSNLVLALARSGRVDEALAQYRVAVGTDRPNAALPYTLGNVLAQGGRVDEAIAQYRQALKVDPGHVDARNNLGVLLLTQDRVTEAITEGEEASRLSPGNAVAHDNFGLALARAGRMAEAAEQFRQAVSLQADFKKARDHLANAQALLEPSK